jgi:thiol-disulfide isomerase/thioredoxin
MNKKIMKALAGIFVLVMVVAGCAKAVDEPMATGSADEMATEEMKDDEMATEEMGEDSMATEEMEEVIMMNDGKMAPDFELMDLNGDTYTLNELKGEKVYLKYWASWCSICLAGLSEVDELSAETEDFQVFTVVTPGANGEQSKADFLDWYSGLEYENINILFDMDGKLAKEIGVRAFPTSVFIGSDGILIQAAPGHKSNEEINKIVESFH